MPGAEAILAHLTAVSNGAIGVAIGWHLVAVSAVVALLLGWRPTAATAARLIALPIASASVAAFVFQNPFNGAILGALACTLAALPSRFRSTEIRPGPFWARVAGALLIAFGLFYPHFLVDRSPLVYLVAAPTGLVPCPTLSLSVGFALWTGGLRDRAWSMVLAAFALFYGLVGVVRLGVLVDIPLVIGAALLAVVALGRSGEARLAPSRGDAVGGLPTSGPR